VVAVRSSGWMFDRPNVAEETPRNAKARKKGGSILLMSFRSSVEIHTKSSLMCSMWVEKH